MHHDIERHTQAAGATRRPANASIQPVEVTKAIAAPVEEVFEAWADPDRVKEWWGPATFTCPFADHEFKAGGKFLFAMRSPAGQVLWSTGTYREFQANRRISFSDFPSNEFGEVLSTEAEGFGGPYPDTGEGLVTVEFRPRGADETELYLRHDNLSSHMHDDCVHGWSTSLDKLKQLVEKQ